MSINIKKYTKDQMAKMVEDAAERLESQKKENAELAEQLKSQTAKTIALRNDLMAKMHSNAVLTEKLDQMNGEAITRENVIANLKADFDSAKNSAQYLNDQGQQYWRAWQASKREVSDLKNKLADAEVALGRANACIATMKVERDQQTKDCFEWQRSAQDLHDGLLNARERANYAEAHPWWNLWAWVKRKLAGKRD